MSAKQLRIGGHVYRIVLAEIDGSNCGEADKSTQTITLDPKLGRSVMEATLLHEVLHCCNSEISHELLDSLSEQLYGVLATNGLLNRRKLNALLALDKQS